MIEVDGLNAGYGKLHILYDVDFRVGDNEMVTVLGPNGSGKSTLLKTIMGLTTIYSGRILFDGKDITKLRPDEKAKIGIAYLPQVGSVFTNLSVRENMIMAGLTVGKDEFNDRLEYSLSMFPFLKGCLDRKVKTLSGGERQMLAMAMALMRKPKILMFDEPTGNLAPKIAMDVFNKIIELKDQLGIAILLVEQNVKRALEISDRAYLLVSGRIVFEGESKELLNHPELGKMYLGLKR
ncbi:MAG: ABC transporter ATP-binding protein [Candidatus Methanomethylicia archaeon]